MFDGKRYYAVFPDENPEIRLRMRNLFDLLKKLDKQFRQPSERFRVETPYPDGGSDAGSCQSARMSRAPAGHSVIGSAGQTDVHAMQVRRASAKVFIAINPQE